MYPISPIYENRLLHRDREWDVRAVIAGDEYNSTKIVDFSIENSLALGDEFEIGTAILSKLTLTLKTNDVIPPNAKVEIYLALSVNDMTWLDADFAWEDADWSWNGGYTEWLPLGEFFIDNREEINDVWVFECYDKLVFADVPYISSLSYPASMQDVWDEICDRLDYAYDASVVIDPTYTLPVAPTGYSMRQVMGYIASANSASLFVGKDGLLKFKRFDASETPVFSMDASDYMKAHKLNPIKSYTRVVVIYDTEEGLFYEAGTGDENHTLYIENPFATQQIADDLLSSLIGFAYLPIQLPARGYPQLEAGDLIELTRDESVSWLDANVAWEDMELPWDGEVKYQTIALHTVFNFRGGLSMSIEAPSKSDQQSEFVVEGTLTQQVNRLNRDAVKQGKPYHGVTITKEDGIITERSDHYSKLTINSDVLLDWEVNGVRKLYYDEDDDSIKFSGIIEASEFIGGSIQIGTKFSVDNTGHFKAVGGEFSGDITASVITGGIITGASIIGGVISVTTDIHVGNKINLNITNSSTAKGIVFNDAGSTVAKIDVTSGDMSVNTSGYIILSGAAGAHVNNGLTVNGEFRANGGITTSVGVMGSDGVTPRFLHFTRGILSSVT